MPTYTIYTTGPNDGLTRFDSPNILDAYENTNGTRNVNATGAYLAGEGIGIRTTIGGLTSQTHLWFDTSGAVGEPTNVTFRFYTEATLQGTPAHNIYVLPDAANGETLTANAHLTTTQLQTLPILHSFPQVADAQAGMKTSTTSTADTNSWVSIGSQMRVNLVADWVISKTVPGQPSDWTYGVLFSEYGGTDFTPRCVITTDQPAIARTAAPKNLTAIIESGTSNVVLSWDSVLNAINYKVYRNGTLLNTISTTTLTDIPPSFDVLYTVTATNDNLKESPFHLPVFPELGPYTGPVEEIRPVAVVGSRWINSAGNTTLNETYINEETPNDANYLRWNNT